MSLIALTWAEFVWKAQVHPHRPFYLPFNANWSALNIDTHLYATNDCFCCYPYEQMRAIVHSEAIVDDKHLGHASYAWPYCSEFIFKTIPISDVPYGAWRLHQCVSSTARLEFLRNNNSTCCSINSLIRSMRCFEPLWPQNSKGHWLEAM